MGSEQSQQANAAAAQGRVNNQSRLQRGHTIAVSGRRLSSPNDDFTAGQAPPDSRPVSPPISVCSDSDLPYVSYTDKLGDSPKRQNKGNSSNNKNIRNVGTTKRTILSKSKAKSMAHDIVVVREANRKNEIDPDIQRLQSIPQFLPVMRGTVSLPANRDPEVLERLHPEHFKNMCNRMEAHLNASATQVGNDQAHITAKMKEVDYEATKVFNSFTEKQKLYSTYAEQFSKLHHVTQQLSRCNVLLNQNIESMEILNNMLDIDDRLPPFLWKTTDD
ncbi:BLOC-1-related complex subunit 5 [Sitodiplosis mosellana]|uniref:BLOC-1-related complex subunit 5 n=1 Tax=Sitodiplosis mosellana TaxID=263140 RepID=UPI002443C458|nr:BLOC-1-related complex subunit 5 [Sitodiplosis mosellana]